MWKHVFLQQHGKELAALSDLFVSMHLLSWKWLFTRGRFFSLKWQFFLNCVRSHANVSMENGQIHRESLYYETAQPPARLEYPFYGHRYGQL